MAFKEIRQGRGRSCGNSALSCMETATVEAIRFSSGSAGLITSDGVGKWDREAIPAGKEGSSEIRG